MAPPRRQSRQSTTDPSPVPPKEKKRKASSKPELPFATPGRKTTDSSTTFESPVRAGSATLSKSSTGFSHSASRTSERGHNPTDPSYTRNDRTTSIATSQVPKAEEIEALLQAEMDGAIFHDPNFVKNFLTVDSARLETVLGRCKDTLDRFEFPKIKIETELYDPVVQVLNTIKQAIDGRQTQNPATPGFLDSHAVTIPAHGEDTTGNKPDLALFDGTTQHWERVRVPIEVKLSSEGFDSGLMQLARYVRAVFANQLYRRHVYGLLICKWEVTFVRFDRSGILHSTPIDMRNQSEEFRKAFAGLMMLDEEAFGYDTAFTTQLSSNNKLEYYIDLPAAAFPSEDTTADASTTTPGPSAGANASPNTSTKRLKVMRTLCHRKSIRGRATIVVRVREVIRYGISEEVEETKGQARTRGRMNRAKEAAETGEMLGTRDYVLKMMWRDPNKKMEGEVLERLVGVYGVAQYMWHSDVFKACNTPGCGRSMENSCGNCIDRTPDNDGSWAAQSPVNQGASTSDGATEGARQTIDQTHERSPAYARRTSRTYCRLLMSTIGSPLSTAASPREFLQAILDAVLGYWRLVNMGLLHRDISDGNVLMLQEGQGYNHEEWKIPRPKPSEGNSVLARSERLLREVLEGLGRSPTGMLNDFDLSKTHNLMGVSFFDDLPSENEESDPDDRGWKRRKLDLEARASSFTKGKGREMVTQKNSSFSRIAKADKNAPRIDFRTGTPTYMSARILKMHPGQQYEHHFMDDLESFFWLILWCAVEHVDVRDGEVTDTAYKMLNKLSQRDLSDIGSTKVSLMTECVGPGHDMQYRLAACRNAWASNSAIVSIILRLGSYFHGVHLMKHMIGTYAPPEAFSMFVEVIKGALDQPESSPSDSESE
ncbi:hypothetical protein FRC12_001620 [Ceratobasidium sp. 428]|nr:hypothetical protein FRC12_001620 [Ceratobasidium sp. 428]